MIVFHSLFPACVLVLLRDSPLLLLSLFFCASSNSPFKAGLGQSANNCGVAAQNLLGFRVAGVKGNVPHYMYLASPISDCCY